MTNTCALGSVAPVIHRCGWCGRVRADDDAWEVPAAELDRRAALVTDGICPACAARYEERLRWEEMEMSAERARIEEEESHGV